MIKVLLLPSMEKNFFSVHVVHREPIARLMPRAMANISRTYILQPGIVPSRHGTKWMRSPDRSMPKELILHVWEYRLMASRSLFTRMILTALKQEEEIFLFRK